MLCAFVVDVDLMLSSQKFVFVFISFIVIDDWVPQLLSPVSPSVNGALGDDHICHHSHSQLPVSLCTARAARDKQSLPTRRVHRSR